MNIEYVEATPDIQTYYELRDSVGWNNFCIEQTELALRDRKLFVLAKDCDKYVAMGSVVGDGMYYTIVDVVVRPEYQGKKIGATIVNKLVELIIKNIPEGGRTSIQLIAAPGKEEFYVKQGFDILPTKDSGAALRKIIYT
ncbi:MAG: GNAT family N-acetyltransferase [Butyrivibrio sp.]|nr:GNAT family N-acetyltransferase [Butyrivibrio sp.]